MPYFHLFWRFGNVKFLFLYFFSREICLEAFFGFPLFLFSFNWEKISIFSSTIVKCESKENKFRDFFEFQKKSIKTQFDIEKVKETSKLKDFQFGWISKYLSLDFVNFSIQSILWEENIFKKSEFSLWKNSKEMLQNEDDLLCFDQILKSSE